MTNVRIYFGYTMVTTVQKWGNSQGVRLPKLALEKASLDIGDNVEIKASKDQIIVKKKARPKFDLAEMVARIPRNYKSQEVDFGEPVGREEW